MKFRTKLSDTVISILCLLLVLGDFPGHTSLRADSPKSGDIDALVLLRQLEDNPVQIRRSLQLDWNQPPDSPGQTAKIVYWVSSHLFGGMDATVNEHCGEIAKARQWAETKSYVQTWIMLTTFLASYKVCNQDPETLYPLLMAQIRKLQRPDLEIFVGGELGLVLAEAGAEKGFQMLEAANQLALESNSLDPVVHTMLRGYSAAILGLQDQHDKSVALQLELLAAPDLKNRPYQKSALLFNVALELMNRGGPDGNRQAKKYFEQSIQLAQTLGDEYLQSLNSVALSAILIREAQFEEAFRQAESAFKVLQKLKNARWQGIALLRLTQSLMGQKKFAEARSYLDQADQHFDKSDIRAHMRIQEFYAQIFEGMGRLSEALDHQKKYFATYTQFHAQIAEEERAKQLASLELDISESKNRELQRTNELQAERLLAAQRLQQFMLALAAGLVLISVLLATSVVQTRKASERKRKMRRILDHIDEGIVTIDSHMKIEAEYSHYLQIFLGRDQDLTGLDALDVLLEKTLLSAEEKSIIRETLRATLGESPLAWELNEDKLPGEVMYQGEPTRFAAMHWVPIYDRQQTLQSVLLGIRDVSTQRLLEAEVMHTKARSLDLQKQLAEILEAGVERVGPLIERARRCFVALTAHTHGAPFLPELHTVKGIARGLGLHILSHSTHDLESQLKETEGSLSNSRVHYQEVLEGYEEILKMFHIDEKKPEGRPMQVLADALHGVLPGLLDQIQSAGLKLGGLLIEDQVGTWDASILRALPDILLHALTNSADHGFIIPRRQGVKLENPFFHLRARIVEQGSVELTLLDNGMGLNRERVEALAKEKNFHPDAHQDIWDVLLLDEVSTAKSLSHTSGRGIGLSAIQSSIRPWQGRLTLRPRGPGGGTELKVVFPQNALQASA